MKTIIVVLLVFLTFTFTAYSQWTIQSSPTTQVLRGVTYADANAWVAVGDAGTIIRSSNGGVNWSLITSPVADALHAVSFRGNIGIACGIAGRVCRTTDAGLSWIQETRPTTRELYCVSMGTTMTVMMGGEGFIYVSTDVGQTWATHTAGTASSLFGVSVHGSNGVGSGGQGAMVMTVNGGSGWGLTVIGNQLTFFYAVSFVNGLTGWTVGSTSSPGNVIARSDNGGFTWTGQTPPITEQLFGVSFAAMDTGTAVGASGTIIHTSNGGSSWASQVSGTTNILNAVSFANTNLGIAVGDLGIILRTTNGGISGVKNISSEIPKDYTLKQNFPNPFNPETRIMFSIPKQGLTKIAVFDALGREIAKLVDQELSAGTYESAWDAANFAAGVYFYRITSASYIETKKMILIK